MAKPAKNRCGATVCHIAKHAGAYIAADNFNIATLQPSKTVAEGLHMSRSRMLTAALRRFLYVVMLILLMPHAANARECVVLLHGLARSDASFRLMEGVLRKSSYKLVNSSYPSTEKPIEQLMVHVSDSVRQCGKAKLHFVTHSMGGILARAWLQTHRAENLGHVVMLAPPNRGSEVVDTYRNVALFEMVNGPAGLQLGTGAGSYPNRLGRADFSLGIIAGNRSVNPILSLSFDGPNDGKVSVASTKIDGMRDHIVLPVTHIFMMNNPLVMAQTLIFLRHGRFDHKLTLANASRMIWGKVSAPK